MHQWIVAPRLARNVNVPECTASWTKRRCAWSGNRWISAGFPPVGHRFTLHGHHDPAAPAPL